MKSVFKYKMFIALKIILSLSLANEVSAQESVITQQLNPNVNVTVTGGFVDPHPEHLTEVHRQLTSDSSSTVRNYVGRIGAPTDLITVPRNPSNTVFGVINALINYSGAPTNPSDSSPDTLFRLLYGLIRTIGQFSSGGYPSNLGAILGDPVTSITSSPTMFGKLNALLQEVRDLSIAATPSGFMKLLKENEKKLDLLGHGTTLLVEQLCPSTGPGGQLLKTLTSIDVRMNEISDHLCSNTDKSDCTAQGLSLIIQLLGKPTDGDPITPITQQLARLARSSVKTASEVRELKKALGGKTSLSSSYADTEAYEELNEHVTALSTGVLALNKQHEKMAGEIALMTGRINTLDTKLDQIIRLLSSKNSH